MRISDWSSDVCSSDLCGARAGGAGISRSLVPARPRRRRNRRRRRPGRVRAPDPNLFRRLESGRRQSEAAGLRQARPEGVGRAHDRRAEPAVVADRSEEHTSELQSLMRISYAVFCLKKKKKEIRTKHTQSANKTYKTHKNI